MNATQRKLTPIVATITIILMTSATQADTWVMDITVDNIYDIYFGDSLLTTATLAGSDANWMTTESWTITSVASSAFLYVATASDHSTAQGFIGSFKNTTTGSTYRTSDDASSPWEVFPAGQWLAALNAIDGTIPAGVWPVSTQPTVTQVQTAVAYATTNNLWVDPVSAPGYDNGSGPLPWGGRPGIPAASEWIWHDTGVGPGAPYPAPFTGFNHDEFLIFRVPGVAVPEPTCAALVLLGFAAVLLCNRNRCRTA